MNRMNRPFYKSRRLLWTAAAMALAFLCGAAQTQEKYVEVRLSSETDLFSAFPFGPMEPGAARLLKIVQRIEKLRKDDSVTGIVLRSSGSGIARSQRYEAGERRAEVSTGREKGTFLRAVYQRERVSAGGAGRPDSHAAKRDAGSNRLVGKRHVL